MVKQDARPRSQESVGTRITRRTVTRGIAWSTPVVAIATAVPAFATSHLCEPIVTSGTGACKCPGQSSTGDPFTYYIQFCVNDSNCSGNNNGYFSITGVVKTNGTSFTARPNACYPDVTPTLLTPLGTCSTQILRYTGTNAANNVDVTIDIYNSAQVKVRTVTVLSVDAAPRECPVTENCPKCA